MPRGDGPASGCASTMTLILQGLGLGLVLPRPLSKLVIAIDLSPLPGVSKRNTCCCFVGLIERVLAGDKERVVERDFEADNGRIGVL